MCWRGSEGRTQKTAPPAWKKCLTWQYPQHDHTRREFTWHLPSAAYRTQRLLRSQVQQHPPTLPPREVPPSPSTGTRWRDPAAFAHSCDVRYHSSLSASASWSAKRYWAPTQHSRHSDDLRRAPPFNPRRLQHPPNLRRKHSLQKRIEPGWRDRAQQILMAQCLTEVVPRQLSTTDIRRVSQKTTIRSQSPAFTVRALVATMTNWCHPSQHNCMRQEFQATVRYLTTSADQDVSSSVRSS